MQLKLQPIAAIHDKKSLLILTNVHGDMRVCLKSNNINYREYFQWGPVGQDVIRMRNVTEHVHM